MSNSIAVPKPVMEDMGQVWRKYDQLPFCVRAMIAIAPYDYAVGEIYDAYQEYIAMVDPFRMGGSHHAQNFARSMDMSFRQDVSNGSHTKAETNGTFRLSRTIPTKYQGIKRRVRGLRVDRAGRYGGIFPAIKTSRGTEINYSGS